MDVFYKTKACLVEKALSMLARSNFTKPMTISNNGVLDNTNNSGIMHVIVNVILCHVHVGLGVVAAVFAFSFFFLVGTD